MFESTHKLDYLQGEEPFMDGHCWPFKVGTCHGLFYTTDKAIRLVAIVNEKQGNGHFTDVLEWFEYAAKQQCKRLEIVEIWNKDLYKHLIEKRGFIPVDHETVQKLV